MERRQEIERSLHTTFSKCIWSRFVSGVRQYQMLSPGDRVCVCISGGKDSMLLAKCMQHLQRVSEIPFTVKYLVMDPGYRAENRRLIEENLALLGIEAEIVENNLFDAAYTVSRKNPCYMCSRMRRGNLYAYARDMGCNKIALGHHFDDMIETVLLSILYGSQVRTMMPKLHSDHFEGMEVIRPFYLVREADIIRWKDENGLRFLQCACRMTEQSAQDAHSSKRAEVKALIAHLHTINPQIDSNIFRSMHNVKLDAVVEYTTPDGVQHSFLDDYDSEIPRKESSHEGEVSDP